MARSIDEIYNSLLEIKDNTPSLSGATSTSNTAIWRAFYRVTAIGINIFEQIQDTFEQDLIYIRDTAQIYSESWWNDKMTNFFQYSATDPDVGELELTDNFVPFYTTVDEDARIVDFCSTTQADASRIVTIKCAKDNGSGAPEQLSEDELSSARGFVNSLQGAGLRMSVVSFPADVLRLNDLDIYYRGTNNETVVRQKVVDAINEFLAQGVTFDGQIRLLTLIDFIQNNVEELVDLEITEASIQPDGELDPVVFTRSTDTKAGYASFDEGGSTINMILTR